VAEGPLQGFGVKGVEPGFGCDVGDIAVSGEVDDAHHTSLPLADKQQTAVWVAGDLVGAREGLDGVEDAAGLGVEGEYLGAAGGDSEQVPRGVVVHVLGGAAGRQRQGEGVGDGAGFRINDQHLVVYGLVDAVVAGHIGAQIRAGVGAGGRWRQGGGAQHGEWCGSGEFLHGAGVIIDDEYAVLVGSE
jgi:hypothetical protein